MNDDELGRRLRENIPEPGPGYWETIDARLSGDYSEVSLPMADTPESLERPTSMDNRAPSLFSARNLGLAAALIALVALAAILLRPGDDDQTQLATQNQSQQTALPEATLVPPQPTQAATAVQADSTSVPPEPTSVPVDQATSVPASPESGEGVPLPDELPHVWRFVSDGEVNYRAEPGLSGELIGTWAGFESGIQGTGRRAMADGFEWIELAATEGRDSGWVARDFIELDPEIDGLECFDRADAGMALRFSPDIETFVGAYREAVEGDIVYYAVAGRRHDGTLFTVAIQQDGTDEVITEEWMANREGMSTLSFGLLPALRCAQMAERTVELNAIVTTYPPIP